MLAAAALLVALASPGPIPSPVEIYRAALLRLTALPQPPFIDDTEHWVVTSLGREQIVTEHDQRTLLDSGNRRECILTVPYTPQNEPTFSPSYFAPDMWLIYRPNNAGLRPSNIGFNPDLSDLKTIANTATVAKPSYDIRLTGMDPISNGGGNAYHLILRPLGDPKKHNLRELWVKTTTYDIMRAIADGDYRPSDQYIVESSTVAEDFGPVGPFWLVIHRQWSYHDPMSRVAWNYDARVTKMSFPALIPAWYFERAQFDRHRAEVNVTSEWQ
jgi:hypothetical protein